MTPPVGWIKLHRDLLDHWVWKKGGRFSKRDALVDLLLTASYKDHKIMVGNKLFELKRGCVLTSQLQLATRWGWNRKSVAKFLEALKVDTMVDIEIHNELDNHQSVISIRNFNKFQSSNGNGMDSQVGTEMDTEVDTKGTIKPNFIDGKQPVIRRGKKLKKNTYSARPSFSNHTSTNQEARRQAEQVLSYLNEKTGKRFRPTPSQLRPICARLGEGHTLEECRKVIDNQVIEWMDDPKMNGYLRPQTLFNGKFQGYLNKKVRNDDWQR